MLGTEKSEKIGSAKGENEPRAEGEAGNKKGNLGQ